MKEHSRKTEKKSKVIWETLEEFVRERVQGFIQEVLEEEVTELLGREKSERKAAVDAQSGYRNGHGKPRKLTMGCGTITINRPRVRDLEERFESRVLPLFVRRSETVSELIPELYLHGLAQGDFDLALRGLLGEKAPLSATTVGRLKVKWQSEMEEWNQRPLDNLKPVYLWADGVYVKAGLEKTKAALLVVMAGLSDGSKVIVAVVPGHRESTESWSEVLRSLKARGLRYPRLLVADGHLGIWGALRNVYPDAAEQRCWNHRILNILEKLPKRLHKQALLYLRQIPYAETLKEALSGKRAFQQWCRQEGYGKAAACLDDDWDRMVTFYQFPKAHWRHLRTSNPIESPFAALRLRTSAAKRFKRVDNATAVIWKMLLVLEQKFRKLNAPELMEEVYDGAEYVNGVKVNDGCRKAVA